MHRLIKQYCTLSIILCLLILSSILPLSHANVPSYQQRVQQLLATLDQPRQYKQHSAQTVTLSGTPFIFENCGYYPYHQSSSHNSGHNTLAHDIQQGIKQGLSCLSGNGPMGSLHPYHEHQALKLLKLLESPQPKTIRCVQDEIFAYAVANAPSNPQQKPKPQDKMTAGLPYPGIIIDTFRLSGSISKKHDEKTYREFYKLDPEQLHIISTGKPVQLKGMHRYQKRDALMFHEMIHWLGHEHSSVYPDLTHLYETCCFAGSDFISDHQTNRQFQAQACQILKDDELWRASKYRQMRLWRYKEYDQLKRMIRASAD